MSVQAQTAGTRGSVKVRPRFFNPFDIGTSRLTLNPFGVIVFSQPASGSLAASATAAASAALDAGGDMAVSAGDVQVPRDDFRPQVRSSLRPPPRLPF
jgi:hypothetical protein